MKLTSGVVAGARRGIRERKVLVIWKRGLRIKLLNAGMELAVAWRHERTQAVKTLGLGMCLTVSKDHAIERTS
jgi:hypothetical protein